MGWVGSACVASSRGGVGVGRPEPGSSLAAVLGGAAACVWRDAADAVRCGAVRSMCRASGPSPCLAWPRPACRCRPLTLTPLFFIAHPLPCPSVPSTSRVFITRSGARLSVCYGQGEHHTSRVLPGPSREQEDSPMPCHAMPCARRGRRRARSAARQHTRKWLHCMCCQCDLPCYMPSIHVVHANCKFLQEESRVPISSISSGMRKKRLWSS